MNVVKVKNIEFNADNIKTMSLDEFVTTYAKQLRRGAASAYYLITGFTQEPEKKANEPKKSRRKPVSNKHTRPNTTVDKKI